MSTNSSVPLCSGEPHAPCRECGLYLTTRFWQTEGRGHDGVWQPRLLGHKRRCSCHLLSITPHLRGEPVTTLRTLQQFICGEGNTAKNWGPVPTAMFVPHRGSESLSPSQAFRWRQPRSWLRCHERPGARPAAKWLLNSCLSGDRVR